MSAASMGKLPPSNNIDVYLTGDRLYGDDFTPDQIAEWYEDEKEGYANLGAKDRGSYRYVYHAWNRRHAFRHLPEGRFKHVLGFGSAYGDELVPLISRIDQITIVDPSASFVTREVHGVPATYVQPAPSGRLPLPDATFDLITCFGVLHHIPNVSAVISELARTLAPGGYLALREPIVSMGDWRHARRGLTKRERGIPLDLLREIPRRAGLTRMHETLCAFPLTQRLFRFVRPDVFNSDVITRVDAALSAAFAGNTNYHPRNFGQQLRPTAAFLVFRKDAP